MGRALAIGVAGHEAFQAYYTARKEGKPHEVGRAQAIDRLRALLRSRPDEFGLDNLLLVRHLQEKYYDYYGPDDDWIILEVETMFKMGITEDFGMPMRLDLLVQSRSTGKILIVDTKHTYDFWPSWKINMSPQFPKYFAVLKRNKIAVDGVVVNQVRYRKLTNPTPEDMFKRVPVPMSEIKIANNLQTHVTLSRQISAFKNLTPEQQERLAVPLLNDKVCQYCSFRALCETELEGGDTNILIGEQYIRKDYGYEQYEIDEEE